MWLAKAIGWWLLPPGVFALLLGTACVAIWRGRKRLGYGLLGFTAFLLYGLSISPVSDALLAPLEDWPSPRQAELRRCDVVAIMSGGAAPQSAGLAGAAVTASSLSRLLTGWRLWRRLAVPILVSGGNTWNAGAPESEPMAAVLVEWGVPRSQIVTETRSRNTWENAREAVMVGTRRHWETVCLVTSAYHLTRTARTFRSVGFEVVPVPGDFRGGAGSGLGWKRWIPTVGGLGSSTAALREYVALVWYTVRYGA